MSEDKKGFIVNDRRHFAPDGSVRSSTEEDSASAPAPAEPLPGKPTPAEPAAAKAPRSAPASPLGGAGVDFSSFLLSLASQASLLLGLAAPQGEAPKLDLPGARAMIGVLEMLQDKSDGRRTPEEDELLEGLLYELRSAYVARSRGGA